MVQVAVEGQRLTSDDIRHGWEKIVYALEPLTKTLPSPYKEYLSHQ